MPKHQGVLRPTRLQRTRSWGHTGGRKVESLAPGANLPDKRWPLGVKSQDARPSEPPRAALPRSEGPKAPRPLAPGALRGPEKRPGAWVEGLRVHTLCTHQAASCQPLLPSDAWPGAQGGEGGPGGSLQAWPRGDKPATCPSPGGLRWCQGTLSCCFCSEPSQTCAQATLTNWN